MMTKTCAKTGEKFTVSNHELQLRKKLGIEGEPRFSQRYRFMHLSAFWQHWTLHKRKCDLTGRDIISTFSAKCDYPVWHKEEWIRHADPPGAVFDDSKEVFPQMWEVFRKSPIAHNMGGGSENSEYTDDSWYSRNCYLCHSVLECEDLKYCFRDVKCNNCQFTVFSENCELCVDAIYCANCFNVIHSLMSRQCSDCAFVFDCRNCKDCMFCSNLRNKQYCFNNEQLTKDEYEKKKAEWPLSRRSVYLKAKEKFVGMLEEKSWLRARMVDLSENCTGDYLSGCKNCENCYLMTGPAEDCINSIREHGSKDTLDCVSAAIKTELVYCSSMAQDGCYMNRFCYNTIQCRFAEYSAHCFQCENIFGCCGLVGKKNHIFNRPYSKEEYEVLKSKIVALMKKTGEYDNFFPGYFAANPYVESLANTFWPLGREERLKYGFKENPLVEGYEDTYEKTDAVPDDSLEADEGVSSRVFWDESAQKPFQIHKTDLAFCGRMNVPLPFTHYARRLQDNFRMMPFTGIMRATACGKCRKNTETGWPEKYEGRILCESCYLKAVY